MHGRTRVDEVGHEHFGFKDGVSQPGIRGINTPDDPALLEKYLINPSNKDQLSLSYDEVAGENVDSKVALKQHFDSSLATFLRAREMVIKNTEIYLSMVNDLDVYVATSMRTRQNFRDMANACDQIFSDARLKDLHLRYFDPTMSAARGHEDKGLIECLMVK